MRKAAWISSAIFAAFLAGCEAPQDHIQKVKTIADVEALFDIEICAKAEVISEAPNPPVMEGKQLVLGFPDKNCVEDFYRAMKSGGKARDILDGKEYYRIVGNGGEPGTLFSVDRLSESSVMLRIFGGR